MSLDQAPGWYGKLPTLGDFASRRLGADFIEAWDLWLGDRMAGLREQQGEDWLQAYLDSPVWRFTLTPACLGDAQGMAMAGVLMASVDRVGRYFPLTLVAPLPRLPANAAELEGLMSWLHRLEDVAVDALQDDYTIDQLEAALALMPAPLPAPGVVASGTDDAEAGVRGELQRAMEDFARFVSLDAVHGRATQARLLVEAVAGASRGTQGHMVSGKAFWLCESDQGARLLVTHGMPARESFIGLFGVPAGTARADAADSSGAATSDLPV
ncbi:MAG: type VI secretion system-associated protein TagF [Aquabacterium sp.]